MYVLAGLGNPEPKYADTRHNVGFNAIDIIHQKNDSLPWKSTKGSLVSAATISGNKVLLVKPQKYMNNSGEVISAVLAYYKINPDKLIVIYDDIDLELGRIRIRKSGGAGTHNGMRNIVLHIGEEFARVRIGIGKPEFGDLADFVLAKPKDNEKKILTDMISKAAEAAEGIISDSLDKAMALYNS